MPRNKNRKNKSIIDINKLNEQESEKEAPDTSDNSGIDINEFNEPENEKEVPDTSDNSVIDINEFNEPENEKEAPDTSDNSVIDINEFNEQESEKEAPDTSDNSVIDINEFNEPENEKEAPDTSDNSVIDINEFNEPETNETGWWLLDHDETELSKLAQDEKSADGKALSRENEAEQFDAKEAKEAPPPVDFMLLTDDEKKEDSLDNSIPEGETPGGENPKEESKPKAPDQKGPQFEKKVSKEIFSNAVKEFNERNNTDVDEAKMSRAITGAWELLTSEDKAKQQTGEVVLKKIFTNLLRLTYEREAEKAYDAPKVPRYTDLAKECNDLLRASMLANTDIYTNRSRVTLYGRTAFGGMSVEEMADISLMPKAWRGEQTTNEAWEKQSLDAKNISIEWSKNEKPYDVLMNNLRVVGNREVPLSQKDIYDRLAAAELMLMSDDSTMIPDPKNALNQIPDWNNRYWKALAQARENLGIPKYVSMRELIQSSYSAIQGVAVNRDYVIKENTDKLISRETGILKEVDEIFSKKAEFAKKHEEILDKKPKIDANANDNKLEDRVPISIPECNEWSIFNDLPKSDPIEPQQNLELQHVNQQ